MALAGCGSCSRQVAGRVLMSRKQNRVAGAVALEYAGTMVQSVTVLSMST